MIMSPYNILEVNNLTQDDVIEAIVKGRVKPIFKYSFRGLIKKVEWTMSRFLNNMPSTLPMVKKEVMI